MKKIIELAEKATGDNGDALSAYSSYLKLKKALEERRTLERTPITEEWLKEHGFIHMDDCGKCVYEFWAPDGNSFSIEKENGSWYIHSSFIELTSAAKVLDMLDVCNIKID